MANPQMVAQYQLQINAYEGEKQRLQMLMNNARATNNVMAFQQLVGQLGYIDQQIQTLKIMQAQAAGSLPQNYGMPTTGYAPGMHIDPLGPSNYLDNLAPPPPF